MTKRRLKFWGWGYEDHTLSENESLNIASRLKTLTGLEGNTYLTPPKLNEISLPKTRIAVPNRLSHLVSQADYDRASHTYGKSYPDYIRAFNRDFSCSPDGVCFPESAKCTCDSFGRGRAQTAGSNRRSGPATAADRRRLPHPNPRLFR